MAVSVLPKAQNSRLGEFNALTRETARVQGAVQHLADTLPTKQGHMRGALELLSSKLVKVTDEIDSLEPLG